MRVKTLRRPDVPVLLVLSRTNEERGELFERSMEDLFFALGYGDCRFSIHKAGRELDVVARHRTEDRVLVAECKAQASPVGGTQTNKFAGAFQAEVERYGHTGERVGYFVSVSGFTETAIEQEASLRSKRMTMLGPAQLVPELIQSEIVVAPESALATAQRHPGYRSDWRQFDPWLLISPYGWLWAVRFGAGLKPSHVAIIHADGGWLDSESARYIASQQFDGSRDLAMMTVLDAGVDKSSERTEENRKTALSRYGSYLLKEFGTITLEGLPADGQVSTRAFPLDSLYVPVRLIRRYPIPFKEQEHTDREVSRDETGQGAEVHENFGRATGDLGRRQEGLEEDDLEAIAVGTALSSDVPRLAVLAAPGGGKSTMVKRLATAYWQAFAASADIDPAHSHDTAAGAHLAEDDRLPDRQWLPIVIRCRQLRELADAPMHEIVAAVAGWAEMPDAREVFSEVCRKAFRKGEAVLLIDGLDEINPPQQRSRFIAQLRTFLKVYPRVPAVITSRMSGFRLVAPALDELCETLHVADLSDSGIRRLIREWHRVVSGDGPTARDEAQDLANVITGSDRLRRFAGNPLLLTTLLLVKRWVGSLPSRRSVLYGKAIEVLLMTWNVESRDPIDPREALPQLAFVAYTMLESGMSRISDEQLRAMLHQARTAMPVHLGFTKVSVSEFVDRIEDRSSLIVMSGHEVAYGRLQPFYEFRHLTFQEYLAALAISDGYLSERDQARGASALIRQHSRDPIWREVIPLAAVMSGPNAVPLVEALLDMAHAPGAVDSVGEVNPADHILTLLADEAQIDLPTALSAIKCAATLASPQCASATYEAAYQGRYGAVCRDAIRDLANAPVVDGVAPLCRAILELALQAQATASGELTGKYLKELEERDVLKLVRFLKPPRANDEKALAIARLAVHAYLSSRFFGPTVGRANGSVPDALIRLARADADTLTLALTYWAIALWGRAGEVTEAWTLSHAGDLASAWYTHANADVRYLAAWAFSELPPVSPAPILGPYQTSSTFAAFLRTEANATDPWSSRARHQAAVIAAFYCGARTLSQDELELTIQRGPRTVTDAYHDVIRHLGLDIAVNADRPARLLDPRLLM